MSQSRLEILLEQLVEEPNDPFNLYAVGLEYLKNDKPKALTYFEQLLHDHPTYIPTYYQMAKLLEESGDLERAKSIYLEGIEKAGVQNDLKAQQELRNAYNELLFDF